MKAFGNKNNKTYEAKLKRLPSPMNQFIFRVSIINLKKITK